MDVVRHEDCEDINLIRQFYCKSLVICHVLKIMFIYSYSWTELGTIHRWVNTNGDLLINLLSNISSPYEQTKVRGPPLNE